MPKDNEIWGWMDSPKSIGSKGTKVFSLRIADKDQNDEYFSDWLDVLVLPDAEGVEHVVERNHKAKVRVTDYKFGLRRYTDRDGNEVKKWQLKAWALEFPDLSPASGSSAPAGGLDPDDDLPF